VNMNDAGPQKYVIELHIYVNKRWGLFPAVSNERSCDNVQVEVNEIRTDNPNANKLIKWKSEVRTRLCQREGNAFIRRKPRLNRI
jgi:hypothetical protein